ncbi:recombinase family protein [Brevibacillus borstelensis]|uniref:recombinase family protein n=1 Tax=Brevibacillus borstelensis TaxID=45462 RepID=UPI0004F39BA8|nr:recombinase family protein [Brevibacillus borstelensis]KKX54438.1 site-specific recombinase [Brevibacillus borstelensis cifa_chp40]
MKKIAAYIRVSTDEQADKGNSLNEQKERLTSYCKAMGWTEPTFYIDDGQSAKNLNRPAIQQLLKDVKQGKIDIVLTTKLDRLCRNLLDLLQTVELFNAHDCNYVSASESFDTSTAVGRMTLQLLGTFAEFERERISERVKDNMMSLAKNTNKALTKPCYGYDIVDGHYVINEEEAKNVRLMFDLAEEGKGHRMIAKILNDHGVKTKRGKMWDQVNVKRLINNETVAGIMIYNKRKNKNGKIVLRDQSEWLIKEDNHPAIITPERFEKVRDIMKSRSLANKHAESETYLLTGLLKCKHCGNNMKGSTSRHKTKYNEYTYYRYICSSYVLGYGCKYHAVHRDDLENAIIDRVKSIASGSTMELNLIVAASPSVSDEIKELKAQLLKLDKRMQKQIEAYELDLISADDLKAARERVENNRKSIQEQIEKLESRKYDAESVRKNVVQMIEDITGTDRVKAKIALRNLILSIEIENSDLVSIIYKA